MRHNKLHPDVISTDDHLNVIKLRAISIYREKISTAKTSRIQSSKAKKDHIRWDICLQTFKTHPVAYLIAKAIENHNREKFKVYGYSIGPIEIDKMNERLQKAFDDYKEVARN